MLIPLVPVPFQGIIYRKQKAKVRTVDNRKDISCMSSHMRRKSEGGIVSLLYPDTKEQKILAEIEDEVSLHIISLGWVHTT